MSSPWSDYRLIDEAVIVIGLSLILFGVAVMGFFETILGSTHFTQQIPGVGVIIIHTSFTPHIRAYIIALGFLILLGWGFYRVGRAIMT